MMEKIKISDLSVGDCVHHNSYDVDMRVVKINGEVERIIAESSSGHGVTCHLDHFSPIPITADILEANGIHRTYEDDNYAIFRGDGLWAVKYTDGGWELSTPPVCRVDIKFIHQLQHALRLAGVDKEIVMPNK